MHWLTKVFDFLPPHQWWFIHSISTLVVHWKIWTSCKTSFKKLAHYPPGQLEDWLAALQWSTGLHSCEPDWICHSLDQQPAVEDHFALAVEGPTNTICRHLIVVVNSFHSYLAHTVALISIRFYGPHLSTSRSYRTWTRGQCHCMLVLPPCAETKWECLYYSSKCACIYCSLLQVYRNTCPRLHSTMQWLRFNPRYQIATPTHEPLSHRTTVVIWKYRNTVRSTNSCKSNVGSLQSGGNMSWVTCRDQIPFDFHEAVHTSTSATMLTALYHCWDGENDY